MKRLAPLGLLSLGVAAASPAQVQPFISISKAISVLQERNLLPIVPGKNPFQPAVGAELPAKLPTQADSDAKKPADDDPNVFRLVKSGDVDRRDNEVTVDGGTEFWFRGYHVFADRANGNVQTAVFTLTGDVVIVGQDTTVTGHRVTINFDNGTYLADGAQSQLSPALIKGQVTDYVYSKADQSYGSQYDIWSTHGDLTTCNLPDPHFHIESDDAEIRPGARLIMHKAKIIVLGHTLIDLPYLSIPLDDRTYQYLPQIGQDDIQGYFIKTRIPIPLPGGNGIDANVDYMSNLGAGLGGEYRYFNRQMNGTARIYAIIGQANTFTFSNDHRQTFPWGTLTLDTDFQQDNPLTAPGSTLLSTRGQLVFPQKNGASTRLSLSRSSSESSGFDNVNQSVTASDTRLLGKARTNLDVTWQDNSSNYAGGQSTDQQEIDVHFRATQDLKQATANFEYLRAVPVGQTQNIFSGGDKTPYLSLTSDSSKLFGRKTGDLLPVTGEFSFGEFGTSNGVTDSLIDRYNLDLRFNKPDRSDHRLRIDTSGRFQQGFYSDGTAQYTDALNVNSTYALGDQFAAHMNYNYNRQFGYSPLIIDSLGRTNLVSADLSYRPIKPFLVAAQSSYDLVRLDQSETPWQAIGVRTEYQPSDNFLFRTYANYDTFSGAWSTARLDFGYKHGDQFYALGASYDGLAKTWSSLNFYMDNLHVGRFTFSTIMSYNGYTQQFDSQQYCFIYDLHCAEAILIWTKTNTGFNSGDSYQFFIRLKAIPFDLPFGFGTQGQPLGGPQGIGG